MIILMISVAVCFSSHERNLHLVLWLVTPYGIYLVVVVVAAAVVGVVVVVIVAMTVVVVVVINHNC
jgi:hypothetical protein